MPISFDNNSYEVTEKINFGGESDVYLVKENGSQTAYVVKMMRAHYTSRQQALAALDEARIYNEFDHAHVAKMIRWFADPVDNMWAPCIVLEYYPFGNLQTFMDGLMGPNGQKSIPEKIAAGFGKQVADGLAYVHSLQIIHADLKPANILLKTNQHCVIADFGISKRLQTAKSFATLGGGTLTTVAPETFSNKVTTGSDVWALGVTLFQMLVPLDSRPVRPLFQECDINPDAFQPMLEKALRAARRDEAITDPMIELICDSLKRDSHLRPSAAEVSTRLQAILDGTARSARRDPVKDLRSAIQAVQNANGDKQAVINGFNLAREAASTPAGQLDVQSLTWRPVFEAIQAQISNCPAEALGVFVGLSSGDVGLQILLGRVQDVTNLMVPLINNATSPVARAIAQIIGNLIAPGKEETRHLVAQARTILDAQILTPQANVLLGFLRNFKSDTETILAVSHAITSFCADAPNVQQAFIKKEAMAELLNVLKEGKLEAKAVSSVLEIFHMLLQDPAARQNFLALPDAPGAFVAVLERHLGNGSVGMQGCRILETLWGERVDQATKQQAKDAFKDQPRLAVCLLQALAANHEDEASVVSVYENLAAFLHVHRENAHYELYRQEKLLNTLLAPLYKYRANPRIVKAAASVFSQIRRIGRPVTYVLLKLVEPQPRTGAGASLPKAQYEAMITELMFTIRTHTLNFHTEPTVKQQLDIPDFGYGKPLDVSGLINVLASVELPANAKSDKPQIPEYALAMLAIVDRLLRVEHFHNWTDKTFTADERAVLIHSIKEKGGRFAEAANILDSLLKNAHIKK